MLSVLSITAPICLCIALGFVCVCWGVFTKADIWVLGQFVMWIALPALLFNALPTQPLHEMLHHGYLRAYAAGSMLVAFGPLTGLILARRATRSCPCANPEVNRLKAPAQPHDGAHARCAHAHGHAFFGCHL